MRPSTLCRLAIAVVAAGWAAYAFAADIRGTVADAEGFPLEGASVRLLAAPDSAYVAGVAADGEGRYRFAAVPTGRYFVSADYIGYSPVAVNVAVKSENDTVTAPAIKLADESLQLSEIKVTGVKTQIKVMEDTIQYNADSYKTQPNAVVEDLLKRLPGVEVSGDGKITANGKEVSKILVDGKEFFSDDPTVASRNLPASMVDKLQVVDRKSDLARLTGVDDGEEETVINLTVKKGMQNGWFGTAEAGYGTDDRYAGSFNVNRFWNGNQITFLGNANNINQMGFTDRNGGRFRRFGGDNGINTTQSLGVNFNVGRDEIFRVGGNVMYSHNSRDSRRQQDRQYLFTDSVSYDQSGRRSLDRGHNINADLRMQWNPNESNTFEFRPRVSLNFNDSESADSTLISAGDRSRVSKTFNDKTSHGHSFELSGQLIYNHKFASRPGRSFSVDARYQLSNVRERGAAYSLSEFFKLDETELYDQISRNHTWSNSVQGRLSWTEPIGNPERGNFLTLAYQARYRWNNADKLTYDHPVVYHDPADPLAPLIPWIDYSQTIFNEDLSNSFRNDYFNQDIRLGYKRVSKEYNLEAGLSIVPQMSKSIDLINSARNIDTRWVCNVAPFLNLRWKLSKQSSLQARYNGRSSQPTMAQLQPVADKSDPMKIVIGNPDLKPSFTHNLNLRFQDFNADSQRSIMAMLNARMTQNSIISRSTFNPETGAQVTTYENVGGICNVMGMSMLSMPLRNKVFQITNFLNINYNRGVGYNNGQRNVSNNLRAAESFGIAFRPDNAEIELRPNYSIQKTWNSLPLNTNTAVHTYGASLNASYYTPFGLVLATDLNYTGTAGYAAGYNKNEWMWNASISYQFLPGNAATVALKVYDLLQQKSDVSRTISANYIDDTRFNALTRYFMVTFTYKFNTFGSGNEPADRNAPRFGGPGGPGGPPGPPPGGARPPRM